MRSALITPFNAFSFFSFVLLLGIYLVAKNTGANHLVLACIGAAGGFSLIAGFLIWTLFEED
jgi:hypothetical protein